jgi:hypothetical protein
MKTTQTGFALLWMLLVIISDCRKNPSGFTHGMKADGVPVYLSHRDYGCEKEIPLGKVRLPDDRLESFSWKNDTLSFTIRFGYVCCSVFSDSVSVYTGRNGPPLHKRLGTFPPVAAAPRASGQPGQHEDSGMPSGAATIEINGRDIAADHCRCMCVYYKDFAFLHPAGTPVRIVFSLQPWPPAPNETLIDTLINIQ